MGGGKSRAICEDFFQAALDYPGILAPIFRQRHISITETTRRTMIHQVIPQELLPYCKVVQSGGRDFIRFPNDSEIHFLGLDDPVKSFSAEFGKVGFDEAHEMSEEDVVLINTRLRQRCQICTRAGLRDCPHYPHDLTLGFNPENPGHWLYQWFIADAIKTETGHYKKELFPTDAAAPLGDASFTFASALDNPFLPSGYVENELGGMPELLRRRYLGGEWIFTSGAHYFDTEALEEYERTGLVPDPAWRFDFDSNGASARINKSDFGRIRVYEEPVAGVSYALGADVATGRGKDYSAFYVTRLDQPKLVCEFKAKVDADIFAEQIHFTGRWYNSALVAIENQGGQGGEVIVPLRDGKGARPPYTPMYRHVMDTRPDLPVAAPYGYPMTGATRPLVLSQLQKMIRERSLPYIPRGLYDECGTFVHRDENPSPRAQDGCNDDCVFAAAITLDLYRRRGHFPEREARRPVRKKPVWKRKRSREKVNAAEIERRYPKGSA